MSQISRDRAMLPEAALCPDLRCMFCAEDAKRGAVWHSDGRDIVVCIGCAPKLGRLAADALHDLYNGAPPPDLRAAQLMLAKLGAEFYRALWIGQTARKAER